MLYRLVLSILSCLAFLSLHAQQTRAVITGMVLEKSRQPVEFASVLLLRLPDSTQVKAAITDHKGRFTVEDVLPGNYTLRISAIGLNTTESATFSIQDNTRKHVAGQFELTRAVTQLQEVIVGGKKSLMNASIDRKVYNVDQDIMSRTGTATDILKNIPSVEVDLDGQVSLRGSGDVMIMINGKPTPLMGRSAADVLQQLPASAIERIEVITNPSARYRPDGSSGIINIVMKKNIKRGFNASLTANAGNRDRYNGNVTVNYKPGKQNFYGNYSIRQDARIRFNDITRTYFDSTGKEESYYYEESQSRSRPVIQVAGLGINYIFNERNSLDASASLYKRKLQRRDVITKHTFNAQHLLAEHYDRLRQGPSSEDEHAFNIIFLHQFPGEDHELNVELTMEQSIDRETNNFSNIFYFPTPSTTLDNTIIKETDRQKQLQADYTNQLSENTRLEAGYDGFYNMLDLDFYGEAYDQSVNKFVKDTARSNRFIYKEYLNAAYGTLQVSHEKFGYSIGLRMEQAAIRGHLVTIDSFIRNNYFKIYPTLHLSYKLNEASELQLNYSKRVNRPDGDELNPFPEYQDPRNISAGNPALLPEIIHSAEFGYRWQGKNFTVVPSLYYRYKQDGFTSVIIPVNDTVVLTTMQNLSSDRSAGLELILSMKAGKWLNVNVSSNVFYNRINAANLGYTEDRSTVSASTTFNANMNIGKRTMMQLMANHRSARLTPQGRTYPAFSMNGGLRHDLFDGKLSVSMTVSDILRSLKQRTALTTPGLHQLSTNRRDGRIVYIGASYRLGIRKEEKLQFDDNL